MQRSGEDKIDAEIGKGKIKEDNADKDGIEELELKTSCKVDSSNMKDIYFTPDERKIIDIWMV